MPDPSAPHPELLVVMPVYNEEKAVAGVIDVWFSRLDATGVDYQMLAVDDGSRDGTPGALQTLREKWGAKLDVIHQANAGHGPAILNGYRQAVQRGVPWIFQIDSDGQCDPQYFPAVWEARDGCDLVLGCRTRRDDGFSRVVVSFVLRMVVMLLSGVNCRDANVPYRLMRTEAVAPLIAKIPSDCFFTNVGISVLALRARLRCRYVPIVFLARTAGETTVPLRKLGIHALTLCRNLRDLLKS
jgi:dolichol-phosphate mannosyltransferase